MALHKELTELIKAGVISPETAAGIETYYRNQKPSDQKKLFTIFGILGAVLIALGLILVVAHNWDDMPVKIKTVLAFVPLLIGQLLCAFTLVKKKSILWKEGSAAFLFLSIGASISLVSQIYHISGQLDSFIFTWVLLGLPLIYLMGSSIAALLYLVGVTWYAMAMGYYHIGPTGDYWYWLLFPAALPHYYMLCKKQPQHNLIGYFNWLVPISLTIVLGTLVNKNDHLITIAYISMFGFFYHIGNTEFFRERKSMGNGYLIMGSLGTAILLIISSFEPFWKAVVTKGFRLEEVYTEPEFIAAVVASSLALILFVVRNIPFNLRTMKPASTVFILFIITFMVGCSFSVAATVLDNLIILALGLLTIREGVRRDHLGIVNYGLLLIAALAVSKFFDINISFVVRGSLFIVVGAGCFAANYFMLKRRNDNE